MDRLPLSPRDDGTFDFFGTFLQTLQMERLGDAMFNSQDGIERLGAFIQLDKLAASGISHEVRRLAQEKINQLKLPAENS